MFTKSFRRHPGMTDISVGDFVRFTRVIKPQKARSHRPKHLTETFTAILEPAALIEQGGSGLVLKVNKTSKSFDGKKYRVGRVDAGPLLGVVTAVLDDAILVGVQQSMLAHETGRDQQTMYQTTGDGA